jgi:hypothetical protein
VGAKKVHGYFNDLVLKISWQEVNDEMGEGVPKDLWG